MGKLNDHRSKPRKKRPPIDRFMEAVEPIPEAGCWIWTKACSKQTGYGLFTLNKWPIDAHRGAWVLFRGPIPAGMQICHHCDVRSCVNPYHLFLGTHKDNMRDMAVKKRAAAGERHGMSKLTAANVLAIRASLEKDRVLKDRYGVTQALINSIRHGLGWKHVA